MGHDSELYNVLTAHNTPAQTKAAELAQQEVARNQYQSAFRNEARAFEALTGQPDGHLPVLASISPTTAAATGGVTITATGSNFNEDSKITWQGFVLSSTYVSPTSLTAVVQNINSWFPGTVPRTVQIGVVTDSSASVTKPFNIT